MAGPFMADGWLLSALAVPPQFEDGEPVKAAKGHTAGAVVESDVAVVDLERETSPPATGIGYCRHSG